MDEAPNADTSTSEGPALNAEALRPAPVPRKRPNVGDVIYVPDRTFTDLGRLGLSRSKAGCDMFFGGWARVSELRKNGMFVEEDPGHVYGWGGLQWQQEGLWRKHGAKRARPATAAEVSDWLAKQDESRRAEVATAVERERQKWLPKKFAVVNRGLIEVPLWDDSRKSKKWAAIVEVDPAAPGGFDRKWFPFGRGPVRYFVPPGLRPGMAVEFAADTVGWQGRRDEVRWHGYVMEVTDTYVLMQPCKDALTAVLRAREAFPAASSAGPAEALTAPDRVSSDQAQSPPASPEPVSA
jgi:hypothetical protein